MTITTMDKGTEIIVQEMIPTIITITTEIETEIISPDVEITTISGIMETERIIIIMIFLVPYMGQNVDILQPNVQ